LGLYFSPVSDFTGTSLEILFTAAYFDISLMHKLNIWQDDVLLNQS